ncbi:g10692 [Coccomyxa elongata]
MDEMTERDLRELDVNLVKMLLAAKDPKKDDLVVQYLNRFFIAINGSKPEIVQLEYKADGGVKTYYKRSFADTSLWNSDLRKGID